MTTPHIDELNRLLAAGDDEAADEYADTHAHELDHENERLGGYPVDRRTCQAIGCPHGDHT